MKSLFESFLAGFQHLLPHHLLSSLVYRFMRIRIRFIKNMQISLISEMVGVDWSESKQQNNTDFVHFNDFFTRELSSGARTIDPDPRVFVSPSDGRISQSGRLTADRIVQAKGHHYSSHALLANDAAATQFNNGFFHNIYLSPRDYHRVHMPMAGKLQKMIHVPGRLFSVAPYTVRKVPRLFARNERVICLFETSNGPMAVIWVGAMLVSSMETVWSGLVTPPRGRKITTGDWSRRGIELAKGAELGRFNMGSTVIVLLPPGSVARLDDYEPDDVVIMGQRLGRLT